MKISQITITPDPYEPFRLSQGYRVGELLFISGEAAIGGTGELVGVGNFDVQASRSSRTSIGFFMLAAPAWRMWLR
jgi:2-iminobutanoate/2-iminopropanoate deaminase